MGSPITSISHSPAGQDATAPGKQFTRVNAGRWPVQAGLEDLHVCMHGDSHTDRFKFDTLASPYPYGVPVVCGQYYYIGGKSAGYARSPIRSTTSHAVRTNSSEGRYQAGFRTKI